METKVRSVANSFLELLHSRHFVVGDVLAHLDFGVLADVEGGLAVLGLGADVGAVLCEHLDDLEVAPARRRVDRLPLVVVHHLRRHVVVQLRQKGNTGTHGVIVRIRNDNGWV